MKIDTPYTYLAEEVRLGKIRRLRDHLEELASQCPPSTPDAPFGGTAPIRQSTLFHLSRLLEAVMTVYGG